MEGEFDKWVAGRRGVCVFSWEWHTHLLRPSYITDFRTQPEAASNATIRAVVFGGRWGTGTKDGSSKVYPILGVGTFIRIQSKYHNLELDLLFLLPSNHQNSYNFKTIFVHKE